jgi:signal transduction histidine kinase
MRSIIGWYKWSIATKILVPFLALSVVAIAVFAYVAFTNVAHLGDYAQQTSTSLGNSAIEDSTAHLNSLGEEIISQKARDVARQLEIYLAARPDMTAAEMLADAEFREIVVQPVGVTGYTTLIDPGGAAILIHKFPGQEKDISPLRETLPSFWALIEASRNGREIAGYYDWQEVDGSITEKYASIVPVRTGDGRLYTLWATTYIEEFSRPAAETEQQISVAILRSGDYISSRVDSMQSIFGIIVLMLVMVVTALALVLSRAITSPIQELQEGAHEIGRGRLDYRLALKSQDEIGDLATAFNAMSADLKKYIDELQSTAAENIAKERTIQENLHRYVEQVNEAQEAERKRVARELHDETLQALTGVYRHLEELASGGSGHTLESVKEEIREINRGIRRFSQELRPSILDDLGLLPALKWLARDMMENHGIEVATGVEGEPRPLPPKMELTLFRIVQEALTNVRKHSGATRATVTLAFAADKIRVSVSDDGQGFAVPAAWEDLARDGKLGLTGIQERAQLQGGRVGIESQPGHGTTLTVEIPASA